MSGTSVIRSAAVVGLCTSASRALGLVREILMATLFGTSLAQSGFVVAFKVPNLFRRLFGEGALSAAFVPVFTESLQKEGKDQAWALAGKVLVLLTLFLAGLVIVGLVGIVAVERNVALGARAAATLPLLRIMLPYMLFICLVALCMGILNSFRHFVTSAVTPVILNVVWIAALVIVCPRLEPSQDVRIRAVAWAVVIAGVVQLAVQMPALWRFGFRFQLSARWRDQRVQRMLTLMAPAAVGMGVHQINVVIDGVLAFVVADWAPAALSYSERLIYLPLGVIATAFGTVLLPVFSHQAARMDQAAMRETMRDAVRNLTFIMLPAAVGLLVLARPILQLTYRWPGGAFDEASLLQTQRALQFYAPGLFLFSLYKVFVPGFYAVQDTRTPLRVGVAAVLLNFALNVTFIITWPAGYKHAGLAFATVLSSAFSCVALAILLRRKMDRLGWPVIAAAASRVLLAALLMGAAVALMQSPLHAWLAGLSLQNKALQLSGVVLSVGAGIGIYLALATVLCRADLRLLKQGLADRRT